MAFESLFRKIRTFCHNHPQQTVVKDVNCSFAWTALFVPVNKSYVNSFLRRIHHFRNLMISTQRNQYNKCFIIILVISLWKYFNLFNFDLSDSREVNNPWEKNSSYGFCPLRTLLSILTIRFFNQDILPGLRFPTTFFYWNLFPFLICPNYCIFLVFTVNPISLSFLILWRILASVTRSVHNTLEILRLNHISKAPRKTTPWLITRRYWIISIVIE